MRFAVVFKTYSWDAFVERQALRCREASAGGDFFISLDETTHSFNHIPFENVFRHRNEALVASGFSSRFEVGSLLWWNADYVHYAFQETYPDYGFYVFVEYDACIRGSCADLVRKAAESGADLVALPVKKPLARWRWSLPHRQTYAADELKGALVCICAFSKAALQTLARRRRDMSRMADDIAFWPSAEVFVPTEIGRANLVGRSLSDFGDVTSYDAFPPMPEESLPSRDANPAFLHPVLDAERYVASLLRQSRCTDFFLVRSHLHRALKTVVSKPSAALVFRAGLKSITRAARSRRQLLSIVLFGRLVGEREQVLRVRRLRAGSRASPPASITDEALTFADESTTNAPLHS